MFTIECIPCWSRKGGSNSQACLHNKKMMWGRNKEIAESKNRIKNITCNHKLRGIMHLISKPPHNNVEESRNNKIGCPRPRNIKNVSADALREYCKKWPE